MLPPYRNRSLSRRPRLEVLENRRVMAAELPFGATMEDTAEFLLGTVTVTPIFLESDGSIDTETQDWTTEEIDSVLAKISEGVNWWSDALDELDTVHSLEFVIDDTYARDPVETGYEPIDRTSNNYNNYVGDFLDYAQIDASLQLDEGMFAFNNSQREKFGTDWAFSIFVADSSDDTDGFFPHEGTFRGAFAFPGGLYMVTPSTRPSSTIAHEMGHIFWAMDEYAGGGTYANSRGYYNSQNLNAWDNPTPGFEQEDSIMAGYDSLVASFVSKTSAESTLAQVGWQDSDGDGIFDVLDVPLNLTGAGSFNPLTSQFEFVGEASVGVLTNQNSSGHQSDITLNRVSRLEVSIDDGPWQTVAEPDAYTASFDLGISVPSDFATIDLRVVDAQTGLTSETLSATRTTPLLSDGSRFTGYAFLDADSSGTISEGESLLGDISLTLQSADGSPLPSGQLIAADQTQNTTLDTVDGITVTGDVTSLESNVEVREYAALDDLPLLHVFDPQLRFWTPQLADRVTIEAAFEEPTGFVEVDVVGLESDGVAYARLEAFDAQGNLVARATTNTANDDDGILGFGESQTLRLSDPTSSIVEIRVVGHANSKVGLSGIRTGISGTWNTDAFGSFSIDDLPAGQYRVTAVADQVTYGFETIQFDPASGEPVVLAATIIDSPRFNTDDPFDVSQDGAVTALDALQVINDLNLNGARSLSWSETNGSKIDVTNDGVVSALDALRVINYLNERDAESAPSGEPTAAASESALATNESSGAEVNVAGIDEVLSEPIKWVSQVDADNEDESEGLVFHEGVDSASSQ
ncbi:dockerin type I domain-containing protein [Rhodopirellula sallentina]|uniref:Protein containing Planctomycete extracellular domain protein n=1 Tax=Rhodopirellula sallentina SM41 TaxID=1263870 RepID=M5U4H4_9BACT|nr:dockerin type I domain-containing protein [Rhodopirellula sallentina]EMI52746.1 hypothetical protein RSSM_05837 [Rhodopirellula sallentina SM41]